jgi:hypothetical protein
VLQTDENDPAESDLYNPAALKYPYADNVYLMFPSLYRHSTDTLDIRLAVSRDYHPALGVRREYPSIECERAPGREVRVALLDENRQPIAQRGLADGVALHGDHVNAKVMWKSGGDVAKRIGLPTCLQFRMENAGLYAFQFDAGYPYGVK